MKKRDKQLNMTHNELMEVKLKSLKKLEDPNLTEDEAQEIENLINLIDKALEELSKPSTKTGWARVWEIAINLLGLGVPYLIKFLLTNKKQ